MDFCDQVIDMEGTLLLFPNQQCIGVESIPCIWIEKDPTGVRFKNVFGQMTVLDTDKYQHIAFKKKGAVFAEDVILLK